MIKRCFAVAAATLAAGPAWADDGDTPFVEGGVSVTIQDDLAIRSDDKAAELNDLYATIEPELRVGLAPGFSVFSHGVLEPVADPGPGEDRAFEDHGFYVEELYAAYDGGMVSVRAGKMDMAFGLAWDETPGLYGTDFVEDYELSERIGLEGALNLGNDAVGEHTLTAGAFFLDTTALGGSLGTKRHRPRLSDGGVSNTEDPSSFAVALDGEEIPALPGLHYRVSYELQSAGRGDTADEQGVSVGGAWAFGLEGDITIAPLAEYAHFSDAGGVDGDSADYVTGGITAERGPWYLAASFTLRDLDSGGTATRDYLAQGTIGYEFDNGIAVEAGISRREESGVETDIIGFAVSYALSGRLWP